MNKEAHSFSVWLKNTTDGNAGNVGREGVCW